MVSIERAKQLLDDPSLSDADVEEIRDGFRILSEIAYEAWKANRKKTDTTKLEKEAV